MPKGYRAAPPTGERKRMILETCTDGPVSIKLVTEVLGISENRVSELLASLRRAGEVELITTAGGWKGWVLAADAKRLAESEAAERRRRQLAVRKRYRTRLAEMKKRDEVAGQPDNWPVQLRVSKWKPIRPPAPISVFTLGAK